VRFTKFIRFGITGLVGFSVDSGLLYVLLHMGFGAYSARAVSIPVAMMATWILNRNWSFTKSDKPWSIELIQYLSVAVFAALINYSIYALALQFFAGITPFWALVLASAVAMFVSYFGYGRVVFGKKL
jgi:putative flippase GtrA